MRDRWTAAARIGAIAALVLATAALGSDALAGNTTYTYDALGRVTTVTYPDGTKTTYVYDAAGNLVAKTTCHNGTTGNAWGSVTWGSFTWGGTAC